VIRNKSVKHNMIEARESLQAVNSSREEIQIWGAQAEKSLASQREFTGTGKLRWSEGK